MQATRPADVDRLPWLEPYTDSIAAKQRVAGRANRGLVAYAGALALLIVAAGGGYWFGKRGEDAPNPSASQTVAVPPARPAPEPVEIAQAPAEPKAEAAPEKAQSSSKKANKPARARKAVKHRTPAPKKIRTAGIQHAHIDAVRAQQERLARSRPWPKMPSPGPAGQVIQLGAFSTATRANNAYQQRIARYPLLGRMPKVVVPVITKPDGRILYVLRLGTTSREQSKVVCRNLRRSGDHCLVIG